MGVIMVLTAFQYEWSSSVVASVLGSYTIALVLGGILLMKVRPLIAPISLEVVDKAPKRRTLTTGPQTHAALRPDYYR